MRLYTEALFSGGPFSYVLFSSALCSGHHIHIYIWCTVYAKFFIAKLVILQNNL